MEQHYVTTPEHTWAMMCRADFGLQPRELAALAAIVAFERINGEPMPLTELQRIQHDSEGIYEIDTTRALSGLKRAGLIRALGPLNERSFAPTLRGIQRLRF